MSPLDLLADALAGNPLLERLTFATLELLVASVVLAAILRCARFTSMRLVACLWLIVIAKPLVTLAVGAPVAILRFEAPAASEAIVERPTNASGSRVPEPLELALDPSRHLATAPVTSTPDLPRTEAPRAEADERTQLVPRSIRFDVLLLAAWAAGAAWFGARYAIVRVRLRRLLGRADRAPKAIEAQYAEIADRLGLARRPALRVTDDLESPAIVGSSRPTILFPRWLAERGASAQAEWALRHELAHARWLDPLAILVRDVASILFFFHPALPWAARRHSEAMEIACDWESLRDPSEATEYAEGLCSILASIGARRSELAPVDALAMATHGRMARRIDALLHGRRARPMTRWSAVGLALTALLVFSFGCGVSRDPDEATPATAAVPDARGSEDAGRPAPTKGMEKPVLDGLRWLLRHQNPDGSWSATTVAERCPCEEPLYKPKIPYKTYYDEALTSLALLGFLGAGFGDDSQQVVVDPATGARHVVGDAVANGLRWLVARQKPDGSISQDRVFMYNEAFACLALTEAYALTKSARWKDAAQKALDFVQAAQRPSPSGQGRWGWRYSSRQEIETFHRGAAEGNEEEFLRELHDSDTSITGWCVLALESGRRGGLEVRPENLAGALAFVKHATAEETGLVGYLDRRGAGAKVTGPNDQYTYHPAVMSALGIQVRLLVERDASDPVLEKSASVILKDAPTISADKLSIDYYYWFHASLALDALDRASAGKDASRESWRKALADSVLALQDRTERDCKNGGWLVADRWAHQSGPIYTTALNVLTLESYYGYENALGGSKGR